MTFSRLFPLSLCGFLVTALLLLTTQLPLVWDEGDTFNRACIVQQWGNALIHRKVPVSKLFSEETLQKGFPATISREGHPAGYLIVIALGESIGSRIPFLSEKGAWRFGPILLFSLALTVLFQTLTQSLSRSAGLFAVSAILLIPRLFVHAQIAFCDSVLLSAWILSWAFFFRALKENRYALFFGLALGLTCSAKATGFFAALNFLLIFIFLLIRGKERKGLACRAGIALAACILSFLLLNPPLWHHPLTGFARFFSLNTDRSSFNIPILFLGRLYSPSHSLPIWNAFFWTAITLPPGLLLAAFGSIFLPRQGKIRQIAFLTLPHAFLLLFVRALPNIPVHDGIRLFIAAFPFWGILCGLTLYWLWQRRQIWNRIFVGIILLTGFVASIQYFPNGLSYYSPFIGGVGGAQKIGMETTYYWDALRPEALDWLNKNTPEGDTNLFAPFSTATIEWHQKIGALKGDAVTISRLQYLLKNQEPLPQKRFRWYVLQSREGAYTIADQSLIEHASPRFELFVGKKTPALRIYRASDYFKAVQEENKKSEP